MPHNPDEENPSPLPWESHTSAEYSAPIEEPPSSPYAMNLPLDALNSQYDQFASPPPPPNYFPLTYPTTPQKRRFAALALPTLSLIAGTVGGMLLTLCLLLFIFQRGFFNRFFPHISSATGASLTTTSVPAMSPTTDNGTPSAKGPLITVTPAGTTGVSTATIAIGLTATPSVASTGTLGSPTVTPTITPTATNTVIPAPTVTILCNNSDKKNAQVCIKTSANATVTIAITACDGTPMQGPDNTSQTADASGYAEWDWKLDDPGHGCSTVNVRVTAQVGSGPVGQGTTTLPFIH